MKSITLIILFLTSWNAFGQSKNKIQKYKITEIQEVYVDSMGNTQIGLIQRMDEKGNIIYLEEYNKRGVLKIKEAYIYLKNGNLAEKKVLNKEGQTVQKEKYSYSLDLNTLVEIFDKNDSLIEYTVISYNGFGEKKMEEIFNASKKRIEKVVYEYDNLSLKTIKTTFDADDRIIEVKKYSYILGKRNK